MSVLLSDQDIDQLVSESKALPDDFHAHLRLKAKRGHNEAQLAVGGVSGGDFLIILRQSTANALDFSAILAYRPPNTNTLFRLRRYNGRSHEHRNQVEGDRFYDFHVHEATQRYQEAGADEDAFARPTDQYSTLRGALGAMLQDCGFVRPSTEQLPLFDEVP